MPSDRPHDGGHAWQRAASFAARRHRHQLRRDGKTPYVAHVARVTLVLTHLFGCTDETAIAAALLHDTIEDTATDYDDIEEGFGVEVAECVAALTKNMTLPEKQREADYERRLRGATWRARLVKLADVYDNLCDAGNDAPKVEREQRKRALGHAARAVKLAQRDAASHADTRKALALVRKLMKYANS